MLRVAGKKKYCVFHFRTPYARVNSQRAHRRSTLAELNITLMWAAASNCIEKNAATENATTQPCLASGSIQAA